MLVFLDKLRAANTSEAAIEKKQVNFDGSCNS